MTRWFPAAFRPPASASWASCPARGFRPSCDRPTAPRRARTRAGFPCSARARCGWGRAPSIPRGRRCLHGQVPSLTAACRLPAAGPCHPGTTTRPGESSSRGISEGSLAFAPSSLPLACGPWTERGPSGFPLSFTPRLNRTQRRMSGRGRASALPRVTSSASLTSSDALTHCARPHVAQVVESDLSPVDIEPAYDGHRDLLTLRRGARAPQRVAYAVHRDASELGRSPGTRPPASARSDPMHVI